MAESNHFALHLERYLKTLSQQGKSQHTVSAYRRDLSELMRLLPDNLKNGLPMRRDFVAALKKLSQKGLSESSLARKLSAWRQYCSWLVQIEVMESDPTFNMKAPRLPERLPKALPQEPLNHILDHAPVDDELDVRDKAMFELMYGSGLRLSEIQGLNLNSIVLDEGWVSVNGKGGKQRQVPLVGKSIAALRDYLAVRIAKEGEQALFTNKNGGRLGQRQIQKRLQAWAVRVGSASHISPHMMRHSYATHLLQASGDIRAVQELLGHSNLSATQVYTKLDFDHLARVYDKAHPRAKRKK